MKKHTVPGLTLGCTSFLVQEPFIPGFRFAAELCQDVALLMVTVGEKGEYLPTKEDIREISRICDGEGVSLHIHLPTDADFDTLEGARHMVRDVQMCLERAGTLPAHSFVLHVNLPSQSRTPYDLAPRPELSAELKAWTHEALHDIAALLPSPEQLAVENLETFPLNLWDQWVDNAPYSRCLDVGHVWKDGFDPAPLMELWLPRIRVIHLHGLMPRPAQGLATPPPTTLGGRLRSLFGPWPKDHTTLSLMPPDCLDAVIHPLWRLGYTGIVNLEIFDINDFTASHEALMRSWERWQSCPDRRGNDQT